MDADLQPMEVSNLLILDTRTKADSCSNRRLDNKFNIFEGVTHNWFFMAINVVMVAGQVMIIFIGGKAFNVVHLNAAQWAYSIVLGFLSIPVGAAIRLVPDEIISSLVPDYLKRRSSKRPELMISDEEEHFRFPKPLADVKEELSFLKRVKGGRLNNLKFAMQQTRDTFLPRSRSGSHSRSNSIPHTPTGEPHREDSFGSTYATPDSRKRGRGSRSRSNSALGATAVMAGIIAGSVAGWSPIERTSGDHDFSRPLRKLNLDVRDDAEIHPGTKPDDPVITQEPSDLREEISPAPPSFGRSLSPPSRKSTS